jgi:hypothetical protein
VIPISISSSSSAKSGDAQQGGSSTDGSFNVNYGNGVTQGGSSSSSMTWIIGAIVAGVLLGIVWKRST